MRIILVRHGEPDMEKYVSGKDGSYGEWLKKYNAAGINKKRKPPAELLKTIEKFDIVVSSDLKRAVDSAQLIVKNKVIMRNPVFREFELPDSKKKYPKFTPGIWSIIFRILWFVGYSDKSENFTDAKKRIKLSAEKLTDMANKHSEIVLVGHGLMNRFIAMELKRTGWKKIGKRGKGYWCYSEYFKVEEPQNEDEEQDTLRKKSPTPPTP